MNSLTDSGEAAPTGNDAATGSTEVVEPIQGPVLDAPLAATAVEAPRLARHQIELSDGHLVGVTVAGSGVPLVVVHGFSAEGFLYAQSLSRLVKMGFRVIAIDTAGHGATQGLPLSGQSLNDYADLLGRAIDELGIERFVVAGHSMGGQLITRMAAKRPDQVMGVVLIDAIVGDTWDRLVYLEHPGLFPGPDLTRWAGFWAVPMSHTFVPGWQAPFAHLSPSVHGSLSSHGVPWVARLAQPVSGLQISAVHGLPSSGQATSPVLMHVPLAQAVVVHGSPSSQPPPSSSLSSRHWPCVHRTISHAAASRSQSPGVVQPPAVSVPPTGPSSRSTLAPRSVVVSPPPGSRTSSRESPASAN